MMKNLGSFLLFTCILAAVPAYAQDITIFGAAQREGKLNVKTATTAATTAGTFDPGTFGTFGLRLGHGKVYGGEHTISYSPNFIEADTKAIFWTSNVMVQAPAPKVRPYGTIGMGTVFTFGTDPSGRPAFGKIGAKFLLNYGGGVKVLPAGPVGIHFDIRGYLLPSVRFNVSEPTLANPLATVKSESQTLNMLEAGIGIVFSLRR